MQSLPCPDKSRRTGECCCRAADCCCWTKPFLLTHIISHCPVCLSQWAPNDHWRRREVTNLWCRCPAPAGSSSARDFPLPPFLTPSPGSAYLKMKIFSLFKKLRECGGTESSKQRWYWHMTKPQIIVGIKTCLLPIAHLSSRVFSFPPKTLFVHIEVFQ